MSRAVDQSQRDATSVMIDCYEGPTHSDGVMLRQWVKYSCGNLRRTNLG